MKRITSVFLALIMLTSCLAAGTTAFAEDATVTVTVDGSASEDISFDNNGDTEGEECGLSGDAVYYIVGYDNKNKTVSSWEVSGITEGTDYNFMLKTKRIIVLAVLKTVNSFTVNAVTEANTIPHTVDIYENACDTPSTNFEKEWYGKVSGYNIGEQFDGIDEAFIKKSYMYVFTYTGSGYISKWAIGGMTENEDYAVFEENRSELYVFINEAYTGTVSIDATVECNHVWKDAVVVKEPTCSEEGLSTVTCSICNKTFDVPIPPTGKHTWGETVVDVVPTCVGEGLTHKTCTVCGTTVNEIVPPSGIHVTVIDPAVEPTFDSAGKTQGKHCETCGAVLSAQKVIAKLGAPALSKVKRGKKAFTVTWKTVKSIEGYQIQYSRKKSMKGAKIKTVKGASNAKLTVKKLKKGKRYYVRIRAYKTIGGVKKYSKWSAKKSVKTK